MPAEPAGRSQDAPNFENAPNFVSLEHQQQLRAPNLGNPMSVRLLRTLFESHEGGAPPALIGAVRRHTEGWEGASSSATTAASAAATRPRPS